MNYISETKGTVILNLFQNLQKKSCQRQDPETSPDDMLRDCI